MLGLILPLTKSCLRRRPFHKKTTLLSYTNLLQLSVSKSLTYTVLRTVVGVEATDNEGEVFEQCFEHGNKVAFANFLQRANNLELRYLIDGVDVINAFNAV
uniref:Uncharacterized protein n=1 Tax=Candidatus Kentrum sp. DK TaxID=2126562 RepID=A0A450THQ6_9GAMM|nr:MAG: hypothetical protein BECKDK2373B_GA0170837_11776 [Candidatus Kentron sp. DK]